MPNKTQLSDKLLTRVAKIHFIFAGLLASQIILYDASKLIPPEVVLRRWLVTAVLLAVSGIVWYFAKGSKTNAKNNKLLFYLILTDILLISYSVYSQRGMSARAVALYAIPIILAGLLAKRVAVYLIAILCIAAYTLTSIAYFVWNFNEGYKVELYGEIGFYSVVFLILAGLVATLVPKKN